MNAAWALVIATIVACGVSGCASGKSVSADSTIDTQAIGVHEVKSVQARCRLTLTNAPGKQVTFNGLLVACGADYLRIRTWKFTRPVVDIAVTPDGVWVAIGSVVKASDRTELEASARDISNAWSMFASDPSTWGEALDQMGDDDTEARYITMPSADGTQVLTVADRSSHMPLRHELLDASGNVLRTLALDQYQSINSFAWPHRMILLGPQGTVVISMSAVRLNEKPELNSFVPPDDAKHLK
jgi:hypothetical protein